MDEDDGAATDTASFWWLMLFALLSGLCLFYLCIYDWCTQRKGGGGQAGARTTMLVQGDGEKARGDRGAVVRDGKVVPVVVRGADDGQYIGLTRVAYPDGVVYHVDPAAERTAAHAPAGTR